MGALRRRLTPLAVAFAAAAVVAPAGAQEPQDPPSAAPGQVPVVPVQPVVVSPRAGLRPPSHPAQATGWARPLVPGQTLWPRPDPAVESDRAIVSSRVAGQVTRVATGADGRVWVRLLMPNRVGGWAPGEDLTAAPAPPTLSPATRASLLRTMATLGPTSALLVRDRLGRTIFEAGTTRPLVLASVTKLATMAAVLEREPVSAATAAAVLGSSNNGASQYLSNRLGRGSAAAGARATVEAVGALGAQMALVDGSGLLAGNRSSASGVADLLLAMRERPRFATFLRGLPLSGRTGTLAGRMRGTSAGGRVRAKTGTLFVPAVSTLAGYVWPAGVGLSADRALVVVILNNGIHHTRARPRQDEIMRALTTSGALVEPPITAIAAPAR